MKELQDHHPIHRKPTPVLPDREPPDARRDLQALLNLGPKTAAWLVAAKIDRIDKIRALGPIEVCRRLRASGQPVSVVMAYALEGALTGCHWNAIPWESKQFLRAEFTRMKRSENSFKGQVKNTWDSIKIMSGGA